MSREIKYRFAIFSKTWDDGIGWKVSEPIVLDDVISEWFELSFGNGDTLPFRDISPYDQVVYQQYTGLRDKRGQEIFEGDILEWEYRGGLDKGLVIYRGSAFEVSGFYVSYQDVPWDAFSEKHPLRVIGNIYESPHLLEQS